MTDQLTRVARLPGTRACLGASVCAFEDSPVREALAEARAAGEALRRGEYRVLPDVDMAKGDDMTACAIYCKPLSACPVVLPGAPGELWPSVASMGPAP